MAGASVKNLKIKACHFRVLSRDQQNLELRAAFGLSQMYHTIRRRYQDVVDEFQVWFENYQTYPVRKNDHI